jgi:hypothetical protein
MLAENEESGEAAMLRQQLESVKAAARTGEEIHWRFIEQVRDVFSTSAIAPDAWPKEIRSVAQAWVTSNRPAMESVATAVSPAAIATTTTTSPADDASVQKSKESEKEVFRLRSHLMDLENAHTEELIELQSQIDHKQRHIDGLEEQLRHHALQMQAFDREIDSRRHSEDAKRQLEKEVAVLQTSLGNMQAVMEAHEFEKRTEIELATATIMRQRESLRQENEALQSRQIEAAVRLPVVIMLITECNQGAKCV